MRSKKRIFYCVLSGLLLTLWPGPVLAVECNEFCNIELAKSVETGTGSALAVRSQCSSPAKINRPARDVFKTGGSRNIPVTCHAVLYLEENTSTLRTWFEEYFAIQEAPVGPDGAGFMGDEILSPLYGPLTAGPVIVVLDAARERQHGTIVQRAEKWLRAYWALSTFAAKSGTITSHRAITRSGVQTGSGFAGSSGGAMSAAAGARIGSPLQGPKNLIHPLLAMATDISPRHYTPSVTNSPGYYGGLRVAARTAGYSLDSQGRISNFGGRTAPLAAMGITLGQRDALRAFLGSGWQTHFPTLQAMVGSLRPACELSFLRTTQGVISWFGTSTTEQRICNRNKGPYFAVRIDYNGTAHYLAPATETTPDAGWKSFRQGNQICADTPNISGGPWCLDLPGGAVQYEISWTKAQGLRQVTTPPPASNLVWSLDFNGNGVWNGTVTDRAFEFGSSGKPIAGDWDGDGITEAGVVQGATWLLDYNGNGRWDGNGTDRQYVFGLSSDTPIIGDWDGDGRDEIGVFRGAHWYLDRNGNGDWDGTSQDTHFIYGFATDVPISGDWNGDGRDSIGVFRGAHWFLDRNGNYIWDGTSQDTYFIYGLAADVPVSGDWNGNGRDSIGVLRGSIWYLDYNGNNIFEGSTVDRVYGFGVPGDKPVTGDWSGNLRDKVGVVR